MQFVGLDVHKNSTQAVVIDEQGNKLMEERFDSTVSGLERFLERIDKDARLVMEACYAWQHLYEHLEEGGYEVKLAHPSKTRAIAEARIKTDSISAETLAHLLRADLLPESYVPAKYVRIERQITRHRASLVSMRTRVKNKVHAILARYGIRYEYSDLFGRSGIEFLKNLDLSNASRFQLDQYLVLLRVLNHEIEETSERVGLLAEENPSARLLMSIPGISYYSALLIMAEIADIRRFPSAKKLCGYAGLVPSTHQSGDTRRTGHLTKQDSRWLRWILIQTANVAIKKDNALKKFYDRVAKKKGHNIAIVATARKMLRYIYAMLTLGIEFDALCTTAILCLNARIDECRMP
jgi:transposase